MGIFTGFAMQYYFQIILLYLLNIKMILQKENMGSDGSRESVIKYI